MEANLQKNMVPIHVNNHNMINHDIQNNDKQKQQHQQHQLHNQLPLSEHYNVNIRFDPITPEAAKHTELILSITDQKLGDPIKEFELVHDKLIVTDIAIQNPTTSEIKLPSTSSVVIGVNEIVSLPGGSEGNMTMSK